MRIDDTALMRETVTINAVGVKESHNYEWVGESPYIYITGCALDGLGVPDNATSFLVGPYRLLRIERDPVMDAWLCVRADRFGALRVWLYRATRWIDLAYRRCIITLAVWGLADYSAQNIPTWCDIHALKRWAKVVK